MRDVDRRLADARSAFERRDWADSFALFEDVRRTSGLAADDLSALGDAAWWLGLIRESLQAYEECHERFLTEGRVDQAAMIALGTGFNWFLRGQPEIGAGWVSRARRLLADQPPSTGQAFLLWMDANGRAQSGDTAAALDDCLQLRRLGRELSEPMVESFALALEGSIRIREGDPARGLELLDEAMLPVLAGRVPPEFAGNLYCHMISVCHDLADVARARHWTDVTQRWCDTFTSAVMFAGICRVHRAQLLRVAGDWTTAEQEAAAANRELADLNIEAVAEARYEIAETHRLRGDVAAARTWYTSAAELGRSPEPGSSLLLVDESRTDEALSAIGRALAEEGDPFRRARLLTAHVEIAYAAGRPDLAESGAAELEALADRYGSPGFRAWALQSRGTVCLGAGDATAAVTALRAALAEHESVRAAYDAATCRALLGQAFWETGDRPAAQAETSAAREVFKQLGAEPRLSWQATLPCAASQARSQAGGLTGREAQILALVAQGLSNREVARRLVISEKTVARHLANVYLKLGVGSRTAAAAWAHRHGLDVAPL